MDSWQDGEGLSPARVPLETVGFVPAVHLGGGWSQEVCCIMRKKGRKKSPEVVVMRRHQHGQVRPNPHEGLCETTESCTASAPDTRVSACHLQQLIGGWTVPLLEKSSNSVLLPVCHMVG